MPRVRSVSRLRAEAWSSSRSYACLLAGRAETGRDHARVHMAGGERALVAEQRPEPALTTFDARSGNAGRGVEGLADGRLTGPARATGSRAGPRRSVHRPTGAEAPALVDGQVEVDGEVLVRAEVVDDPAASWL